MASAEQQSPSANPPVNGNADQMARIQASIASIQTEIAQLEEKKTAILDRNNRETGPANTRTTRAAQIQQEISDKQVHYSLTRTARALMTPTFH